MGARRSYVSIGGAQVHCLEDGSGPALLLLHAVPRSNRSFRRLAGALARDFRTIAPDLPGFGQSDALEGELTIERWAGAMRELLAELGIERAHVFGLHTGNKVAAAIAAEHVEVVDRLVLCGQTHSLIPDKQQREQAIGLIVAKYFTDFPQSADGEEHLRRWLRDWSDVSGFALPRSIYSQSRITSEDIDQLVVRVLDHVQALASVRAAYAANFAFDLGAALGQVKAPTLVIELATPAEEHYGRQLDAVCAQLENARGATIENADGGVLEERTDELAQLLREFLL